MGRVKNDFRSKLSSRYLSDLMMLKLSMKDLNSYNPEPAIKLWYGSGERRLRRKYGSRSKPRPSDCEDSLSASESADSDTA